MGQCTCTVSLRKTKTPCGISKITRQSGTDATYTAVLDTNVLRTEHESFASGENNPLSSYRMATESSHTSGREQYTGGSTKHMETYNTKGRRQSDNGRGLSKDPTMGVVGIKLMPHLSGGDDVGRYYKYGGNTHTR